jgi:hypothetical protein
MIFFLQLPRSFIPNRLVCIVAKKVTVISSINYYTTWKEINKNNWFWTPKYNWPWSYHLTAFRELITLVIEFLTMDEVQKPSINECYTPSSEPYRVY